MQYLNLVMKLDIKIGLHGMIAKCNIYVCML